jgi:hypothetical protein
MTRDGRRQVVGNNARVTVSWSDVLGGTHDKQGVWRYDLRTSSVAVVPAGERALIRAALGSYDDGTAMVGGISLGFRVSRAGDRTCDSGRVGPRTFELEGDGRGQHVCAGKAFCRKNLQETLGYGVGSAAEGVCGGKRARRDRSGEHVDADGAGRGLLGDPEKLGDEASEGPGCVLQDVMSNGLQDSA